MPVIKRGLVMISLLGVLMSTTASQVATQKPAEEPAPVSTPYYGPSQFALAAGSVAA
jgi:hypothetical protein